MKELYISAHPDDETLGCGGTILKHLERGDEAYWLVATQAHEPEWSREIIEQKDAEVQCVAEAYGFARCFRLGFETTRLDLVPRADLIERIREVVAEVRPESVYVTHPGDVHTDHGYVYAATAAVLRGFHMKSFGVRRLLCYETLSSTDQASPHGAGFTANVFTDITPFLERKLELMALYETELHPEPLPRTMTAIRSLARYRGATIGVEYAEAFQLVRALA